MTMNKNPVFGNYLYAVVFVWIIGQTVAVYFATDLPLHFAIVDTVIFNVILASCIVLLWYPVRYNQSEHFKIAFQILLAWVFVIGWLGASFGICFLIGSLNAEYRQFLLSSLWWKALMGLLVYIISALIYHVYIQLEQLSEKSANEIRLSKLLKDAELNILKSQINPHFLFNSMNSVNSMILQNPEQAQKMLVALSDYMRYAVLATNNTYSCVSNEMENIARYISIEKMRFGDKLAYEPDIDPETLNAEIPSMILQPLFENAIKHGVYESLDTVRIMAKITKDNDYLTIKLSNNFDAVSVSHKKGSGTGLQNIRERLRLLYESSALIQTKSENGVFTVILKIEIK
jgi:sensor histidine kinase YesM